MADALITFLHVLVFVYWLGGDLGSFYASQYLTRAGVTAENRLLAATIVNNVDMAPRTSLILAFPTGLALASIKGWLTINPIVLVLLCVLFAMWLAIVWTLHINAKAWLKRFDLALRFIFATILLVLACWSLAQGAPFPFFISLKSIALAGCICLGLLIRHQLAPLAPALAGILSSSPDEHEQSLKYTLESVRPLVVGIWALLILAALLGLWTPTL